MTLKLHVLNVEHGSSIVVEFNDGAISHYGVIDSNCSARQEPKALKLLKQLGADKLAFVALTHPHSDHYSGLYEIIKCYNDKIGIFISCPFGELLSNKDRLNRYASHLLKLAAKTDGDKQRHAAVELVQIIRWASSETVDWQECSGEEQIIGPPGFGTVKVSTIMPPRASKGQFISKIENNSPEMFGSIDDNDLSLMFQFEFAGSVISMGGDATRKNWQIRKKYEDRVGREPRASVVNLPHHGSKYDNPPEVLERMFNKTSRAYGITSANGQTHPDSQVIEWMSKNSIHPYCTNLMPMCGANVARLQVFRGLDEELARKLREWSLNPNQIQECQGDIMVEINSSGDVAVTPQINAYCPYR